MLIRYTRLVLLTVVIVTISPVLMWPALVNAFQSHAGVARTFAAPFATYYSTMSNVTNATRQLEYDLQETATSLLDLGISILSVANGDETVFVDAAASSAPSTTEHCYFVHSKEFSMIVPPIMDMQLTNNGNTPVDNLTFTSVKVVWSNIVQARTQANIELFEFAAVFGSIFVTQILLMHVRIAGRSMCRVFLIDIYDVTRFCAGRQSSQVEFKFAVAPVFRMVDLIKKLGSTVYLLSMEEQADGGVSSMRLHVWVGV